MVPQNIVPPTWQVAKWPTLITERVVGVGIFIFTILINQMANLYLKNHRIE